MNLADITTKCYILALIIRDDGERLLLGDGAYEFKDSQQHFIANTYANDVVELQGTDGQMLAGQVRRTATQTFAGYIGDATFSKQRIEEARRDFLMFFRKKHYYTAVYVFSDGTAIQRDRGYIVNAPSVPELYQRFPEWSVGLNFEDPNYYEYAEDDLGHEIAAHKVELELSTAMSGGLIWDGDGAVSDDLSYVGTEIPGEGKNFQLADTGTATLKSAELLGDATQTTYSGKNLFDMDAFLTAAGSTYTKNGNIYSISNIGTAYSSPQALNLTSGTTYTISQVYQAQSTTNLRFEILKNGSAYLACYATNQDNLVKTFTADSSTYTIRVNYSTVSYPFMFNSPMLEASATKTAYEPYVGGTASPNPDYPQAVNTVTGENVVKIEGKNLAKIENITTTSHGMTYTFNEDGTITLNGTTDAVSTAGATLDYPIRIRAGQIYTFSANNAEIGASITVRLERGNGQSGVFASGITNSVNKTWSFNGEDTDARLQIRVASGITLNNFTLRPQLELGSTATTYETYQGQEFPIGLASKNLASLETSATKTVGGLPFTTDGGIISINGTATGDNFYFDTFRTPSGSATLSAIITGYTDKASNSSDISIQQSTDGTTWTQLGGISFLSTQPKARSVTLEANKLYRVRMFISGGSVFTNATIKLQLELGTQATQFAPYFTPIELAKIPNTEYEDEPVKVGDTWYIRRAVGKVVLDGSETGWGTQNNVFRRDFNDARQGEGYAEILVISDHFTGRTTCYRGDIGDGKCAKIVGNNRQIGFRMDSLNLDVDAFKTWLASHPTTVYYALAEPVDEEITNSELVGQLERLKHARTYADTTNFSITATSPNLPAFLKVVAFGDDAIPQGGYVWEDGGTGGATIITVDGVDNAQPIWTVVGPATNPSLTNITTGESIQWTGVVPNGQTLVVNMADMTASLSGANVFEFISGSWITLQAGNNRVSYSATAATGIATLEWNGVVG